MELTTHPPSSAEVEGRVELYLYSPSGLSWPLLGRSLTLPSEYYGRGPPAVWRVTGDLCLYLFSLHALQVFLFSSL